MRTTLLLLPLLGLAPHPRGEAELVQRHVVGAELASFVVVTGQAELVDFVTLVDGEAVVGAGTEVPSRSTRRRTKVAWRERVTAVADGRVTRLERRYGTATRSSTMTMDDPTGGRHEVVTERASDLTGEPLVFAATEEGWSAALGRELDAEEVMPAWLEGLEPAPHWNRLLPEEPVVAGDTWDLPVALVGAMLEPGGDLAWRLVDAEAEDAELVAPAGTTAYEGSLRATLTAVVEGQARVGLVADLTTRLDLTPWLPTPDHETPHEGPHPPDMSSVVIVTELEGRGAFTWDLAAGRLVSLTLDLEGQEVETVGFGHHQLGAGLGPHDVEIQAVGTSRVSEALRVTVEPGS